MFRVSMQTKCSGSFHVLNRGGSMALIIYTREKRAKKFFFLFLNCFVFDLSVAVIWFCPIVYNWYTLSVTHRLKCECAFAASRWYRIFRSKSVCGRLYMSVLNAHFVSMIVCRYFNPIFNCLETTTNQHRHSFGSIVAYLDLIV